MIIAFFRIFQGSASKSPWDPLSTVPVSSQKPNVNPTAPVLELFRILFKHFYQGRKANGVMKISQAIFCRKRSPIKEVLF